MQEKEKTFWHLRFSVRMKCKMGPRNSDAWRNWRSIHFVGITVIECCYECWKAYLLVIKKFHT